MTIAATRRQFGRIAAVGAVALVLAGAVATPGEARTRQQAARTTRADGVMCAEINGHHVVTASTDALHPAPRRIVKEAPAKVVDLKCRICNRCYSLLLMLLML